MSEEIKIKLGVDSSAAMNGLKTFRQNVDTAFNGLASKLAGVFAVGTVVSWGREILASADRIKNMAEQLDVSTTFLQRFEIAASTSGSTAEKAQAALDKLSRSLADAKDPTSEAAKEFSKWGVQIRNADGSMKTVEQTVNAIADAMQSNASAADRNRMAYELLGKSGQSLVNTLSGGSAGLRQAGLTGSIYSEKDINRLERFGNAVEKVGKALQIGLVNGVFGLGKILKGDFSLSIPTGEQVRAAARKRFFDAQAEAAKGPSQEVKAREVLAEYDKKHEESLRRQATLNKQRVADNQLLADIKQRQVQADAAAASLTRSLADRGRFTVEELATLPGPFQRGAQQVRTLEEQARFKIRFGGSGEDLFNRADAVRKTLTPLTEGERFPFQDLRENARKSSEELAKLNAAAQGYGIKIIPRNGP